MAHIPHVIYLNSANYDMIAMIAIYIILITKTLKLLYMLNTYDSEPHKKDNIFSGMSCSATYYPNFDALLCSVSQT